MPITVDQLINDCRAALDESTPQAAMREVLERAVSRPSDLLDALPAPGQQSLPVHVSPELTILQVVNGPGFVLYPHDHGSWSATAMYAGQERSTFYRRTADGTVASGGKEYAAGEVVMMGADAIHAIENPLTSVNAAIHVFAGNPFIDACSQWDFETLTEVPFDIPAILEAYPSPA
jgi:predicted metal-dependent enzyme (double-stranded beta helix superfamily)